MVSFNTTILKFDRQGEKTGWTYILIPAETADKIKPGVKKSFQVKGKIDDHSFEGLSLLPMGGGDFILALKADIRKAIGKRKGDKVKVQMEPDTKGYQLTEDLLQCLADDPVANAAFNKMPLSHRNYYSKWVESAKTELTKAKRIAMAVNALAAGLDYGGMLRKARDERKELGI